ncbi:MAG TPA: hypothetical protein VF139_02480 [Candidatus Polarisedimenticolaceae bacterium]
MSNLSSLVNRSLFLLAFVLAALAVVEKAANLFDYTVINGYSASRLLELAAVALLFVIALLLREVRESPTRS